jgi:type I restriction-modification system DNA methylase subunit
LLASIARLRFTGTPRLPRTLAPPGKNRTFLLCVDTFAGMPPAKNGDYAWVQHMIKSMAVRTGRMAVVLPHGALFRGGKEGEIRKKLLHMDLLEAVIGLGPNLFYGAGLAACILVFRQRKSPTRKKKVLIVDASREFKTGRAQNELLPKHVERIYSWYRDYKDVEGVAHVASLDEIAANDHNLNIPRYVAPKRLEKIKERHEQGFLTSLEFLKEMLELAKEVVEAEKGVDPVEERDRAREALTELFNDAKGSNTHIIVERIVTDIDDIVKKVRFPEWQHTSQGEPLVQKELRRTLLKYKLHTDQALFDKAYGYIRQYY